MLENPNSLNLETLIKIAQSGHCPLFQQDWIRESLKNNTNSKKLTLAKAKRIVEETLKKLEHHRSIERKQVVLSNFNGDEREEFIQSFYKVMECKTLDEIKELH